ncbi:MAG: 50S ribosomal protein L33 [Candidatus Pacebacteria bacterium]|nr:50S ribosomal protein L33 [Candidatus Paceibacterota bacterium]NUQ57329.1 50S ribosomal protein L33 [Candidatus Paceibacter sp.]
MSKIQEYLIKLQCKDCKRVNYWTRKNKKKVEKKLEAKKHCPWCGKHAMHKELKK